MTLHYGNIIDITLYYNVITIVIYVTLNQHNFCNINEINVTMLHYINVITVHLLLSLFYIILRQSNLGYCNNVMYVNEKVYL